MSDVESSKPWWLSPDLVLLTAHHLVDTGEITSCSALLRVFEHPELFTADWRQAMKVMADGREREPLGSVPRVKPVGRVPGHVGVRHPPVIVRPDQPCLFSLEAVA